jgi:hypothetical protein
MSRSLVAPVIVAFATATCAFDGPDNIDFNSTSTSSLEGGGTQSGATIDGVMWWWNVSWSDVKDTPDWVPGDEPAISMPKAIQLAQAELTKYTETPQAYRLDGVQWSPITECCSPTHARKWIYVVSFERMERFESGARGTMTIPVLLDGRVITGVKERGPR